MKNKENMHTNNPNMTHNTVIIRLVTLWFKSKSMDFVFRMAAVATLLYKIAYRIIKSLIRNF